MEKTFGSAFRATKKLVEQKYGIPVRLVSFAEGFSGDLNGAEIFINHNKSIEEQLFNLLHLFGHTVQWAVRPDGYALGYKLFHRPNQELLKLLIAYEREAARYSIALLVEAGAQKKVAWMSKYSDCDIRFLRDFYKTGRAKAFNSFRRKTVAPIKPLLIPLFKLKRRKRRIGGIVVSTSR